MARESGLQAIDRPTRYCLVPDGRWPIPTDPMESDRIFLPSLVRLIASRYVREMRCQTENLLCTKHNALLHSRNGSQWALG